MALDKNDGSISPSE